MWPLGNFYLPMLKNKMEPDKLEDKIGFIKRFTHPM